MHQGTPHNLTTTAAGYGSLNALGLLAGAFGDHVPSKADFDAAVSRVAHVKVSGKPIKKVLPSLMGDNPAAAKVALRNLNRVIDSYVTLAGKAEKAARTTKNKKFIEKSRQAHEVADDLKTISLFIATKFQSRALTNARAHGISAAHPSLAHLAKLSSKKLSGKMSIGEEIPSGVPVISPEISYLGSKANEIAGDDFSEIGAALAGYAGACGCGYSGAADDVDDDDGGIYDVDEDAQLFLLIPAPSAGAVEAATRVYPGAAKALSQGYTTRSASLAARAFSFLRKQRVANADVAWAMPAGSAQAIGAMRAMSSANALILHWARKYYERFMEDLARAKGIKTSATPTSLQPPTPKQVGVAAAVAANPAMQLAASTAAKNEAASAAAAVIKASPSTLPKVAAAIGDKTAKRALAAAIKDYREELTKEILDEAALYGRAVAQSNRLAAQSHRKRLLGHLAQRRSLIVRELGLNARQAQSLFALESQIMTTVADRAGHDYRLGFAKTPPARAKITAKISLADRRLAELRARRHTALQFAKQAKPSTGLAGLMVDVGDAISDLGWAGVGLGAAGLVIGGALGSR